LFRAGERLRRRGRRPIALAAVAFAPTSFWNAPLPRSAPVDSGSSTYVMSLSRMVFRYGAWINTTSSSEPVYTVPAHQPTVTVKLNRAPTNPSALALADAFAHVPIPPGAMPAAGPDHNLVVVQPATDTMWEMWLTAHDATGWHAGWGGRMTSVSTSPGHYQGAQSRWGASATSLPVLGGLMRLDELASGHIDHALALSVPDTRARYFSWPAQRTDGNSYSPTAIPEGTRFRLPPDLNLDTIPMSPIVREMAQAVQKYGLVVRDRGGAVAFYGEDPTPTGANPYLGPGGFFGGKAPSALLAQFPWSRLQALKTQLSYDPI
jgi:hypothetical protein